MALLVYAVLVAALVAAFAAAYVAAARVAYRGNALRLLRAVLAGPRCALERRGAPLVIPTAADFATVTRALSTGRIMLLSLTHDGDGAAVKALGENGSVYQLTLGATTSCSCPAYVFKRTAQCKHLAWLKIKVLDAPPNHYLVYQTSYLAVELRYLLAQAAATAHLAPRAIREAVGVTEAAAPAAGADDTCAICYDDIDAAAAGVRCAAQCRKLFHSACVEQYVASLAGEGKPAVCACCRAPWAAAITLGTMQRGDLKYVTVSHHPAGPAIKKRRGSVI